MGEKTRPYIGANIVIYGMVLFIVEFVRGAYLVSYLPIYAENVLGYSVATVGVAISVHYIADTVIKLYAGYLLDRFSFRLIIQLSLIISFGGLLLIQNAHQLWMLVVAVALFGVGISPIWLVCLSKIKPENRAANMGVLYTCWLCGLGAGPVVINFLIDKGYAISYWTMLIVWGIGWILSLFISDQKESTPTLVPVKRQMLMLWDRLRSMRSLLPGMVLQTTAAGMLVPILPGFASKYLGLEYSQYSYVLIAGGAITVLFLIPMGKWSDRQGRKWFLILGFSAFAIMLFNLTLISTLWQAILLAAALGFSYATVLPAWNALLAQHVPQNQQGMGWGLFSSVEGIGVIIGPVLGGWMAHVCNERVTVWASAGLMASIALYYLIVSLEEKKEVNKMGL